MRKILLLMILFLGLQTGAQELVVIGKESKVYDSPNVKGYATTNRQGQNVVLSQGMVFVKSGSDHGWDLVEYTPGLKGYILQSLEMDQATLHEPKAGNYTVKNNSSKKVEISGSGVAWVLNVPGGKPLAGSKVGKVIVFRNEFGNVVYSLISTPSGPVVMDYDNKVTSFF